MQLNPSCTCKSVPPDSTPLLFERYMKGNREFRPALSFALTVCPMALSGISRAQKFAPEDSILLFMFLLVSQLRNFGDNIEEYGKISSLSRLDMKPMIINLISGLCEVSRLYRNMWCLDETWRGRFINLKKFNWTKLINNKSW